MSRYGLGRGLGLALLTLGLGLALGGAEPVLAGAAAPSPVAPAATAAPTPAPAGVATATETARGYVGQAWDFVVRAAPRAAVILALLLVLHAILSRSTLKLSRFLVGRVARRAKAAGEVEKRIRTLGEILRRVALAVLWIVGGMMLLGAFGVNLGPVLATVGIFGLALSFGAQNLVRDVISGFFMLVEDQVRVGDVAVINGTGGLVERIGLRTIVLRDLAGTVHVFPNGSVNTLANMTKDWSAAVLDIGVAYKEDVERVIEVMRAEAEALRADQRYAESILEPIEIFGLDEFADSAVVIKCRLKTLPIKQWEVGRAYRLRLKKAFDKAGIEIPFPHRTLYLAEGTLAAAGLPPAALAALRAGGGAPPAGASAVPAPAANPAANPSAAGETDAGGGE